MVGPSEFVIKTYTVIFRECFLITDVIAKKRFHQKIIWANLIAFILVFCKLKSGLSTNFLWNEFEAYRLRELGQYYLR